MAIFVFVKIAPHAGSVWPWRYVETVVLVLSFIPDVFLARSHEMGGGWPEAYALMIMHVVVWAICITLLPGLASSARSAADKREDRLSILEGSPAIAFVCVRDGTSACWGAWGIIYPGESSGSSQQRSG